MENQRECKSLLEGELVHEGLQLCQDNVKGRYYKAKEDIAVGTVVIRTYGIMHDSESSVLESLQNLLVQLSSKDVSEREEIVYRLQWLTPQTHSKIDQRQIKKYNLEPNLFSTLMASIPPSILSDNHIKDTSDLILLFCKIDLNSHNSGLFPLASFLNHSCYPTCSGSLSEDHTSFEIRTLSHLPKNCELSINYLDEKFWFLPTVMRRQKLETSYFFQCCCIRCNGEFENEKYLNSINCKQCDGACFVNTNSNKYICQNCGTNAEEDTKDVIDYTQRFETDLNKIMESESFDMEDNYEKLMRLWNDELLYKFHWMKMIVLKNLIELSYEIALEKIVNLRQLQEEQLEGGNSKTDTQQQQAEKYQRDHLTQLKTLLQFCESLYPPNTYPVSSVCEKLNYICDVLGLEEEAKTYSKRMCHIRDVCGWFI